MNYVEFEKNFKRKDVGNRLQNELIEIRDKNSHFLNLDSNLVSQLLKDWLPENSFYCTNPDFDKCTNSIDCTNRCSTNYWLAHSYEVADIMKNLALLTKNNVEDWYNVGLIHDVDYLKNPHHQIKVSSEKAHPITTVKLLMEKKIHPNIALAVLEHAPHLMLKPSSSISNALIAADELSTMIGIGQSVFIDDVNPFYHSYLKGIVKNIKFEGYIRDDMQERFTLAINNIK